MPDQRIEEATKRRQSMERGDNPWHEYAAKFGEFVAKREEADLERDPILAGLVRIVKRH